MNIESIEDFILDIVSKLPNECACLDYKAKPYTSSDYGEMIQDVLSFLNSVQGFRKHKAIVFGIVEKSGEKKRIGIDGYLRDAKEIFDDSRYQEVLEKICPVPYTLAGTVSFDGQKFGFLFIDGHKNLEGIYEPIAEEKSKKQDGSKDVHTCQTYTRRGSKKCVMTQADRDQLLQLYGEVIPSPHLIKRLPQKEQNSIVLAAVLGTWVESNPMDRAIIETLTMMKYFSFIRPLRKLYECESPLVRFEHGIWRVKNPESILTQFGKQLYDDHLERIGSAISLLAQSISNPSVAAEMGPCSEFLRFGFAQFLAVAGNHKDAFSFEASKLEIFIMSALDLFLVNADETLVTGMADYFSLLAEAHPGAFAARAKSAIMTPGAGLANYLSLEQPVEAKPRCFNVIHALSVAAIKRESCTDACFAIFGIIETHPDELQELTSILLPCFPKTEASSKHRLAIVKRLFEKNENLAWKLLYSLLRGKTSLTRDYPDTKYLRYNLGSPGKCPASFQGESQAYLSFALDRAKNDSARLESLLDFFGRCSRANRERLIQSYRDFCENKSQEERYIIWNALLRFINRHRRYQSGNQESIAEFLLPIENLAKQIAPQDRYLRMRRVFSENEFDLIFDSLDSYDEARKRMEAMRLEELESCYQADGLECFMSGLDSLDANSLINVGRLLPLASFASVIDSEVSTWLLSDSVKKRTMARVYVETRYATCGECWLWSRMLDIPEEDKRALLWSLPITEQTLRLAEETFGNEIAEYWSQVPIPKMVADLDVDNVVDHLLKVNRARDAVQLLWFARYQKPISGTTLYRALMHPSTSHDLKELALDPSHIRQLIQLLQDSWAGHENEIARLEWVYSRSFCPAMRPKILQQKLTCDASFFVDTICGIYKEEHKTATEPARVFDDDAIDTAARCRAILWEWEGVPGIAKDGSMNSEEFREWFEEVKDLSRACDRHGAAMYHVGKVLFHVPRNKVGSFIDPAIGDIIEKEGLSLRAGYMDATINSGEFRYIDPSGKAETELGAYYDNLANQADECGWFEFSTILRQIGKVYYQEAELIIATNGHLRLDPRYSD